MQLPDLKKWSVWFVTGSQHLYGEETLRQVDEHSAKIADTLNAVSYTHLLAAWYIHTVPMQQPGHKRNAIFPSLALHMQIIIPWIFPVPHQ